jgi:hypothetical protein
LTGWKKILKLRPPGPGESRGRSTNVSSENLNNLDVEGEFDHDEPAEVTKSAQAAKTMMVKVWEGRKVN